MLSLIHQVSLLEVHWEVVKFAIVAFIDTEDVVRLQASSKSIRLDTTTVDLLLRHHPTLKILLHSPAILLHSPVLNGDLFNERLYDASALSIACAWEKYILPKCYKWREGSAVSIRLEPFVMPLPKVNDCNPVEVACEELNALFPGVGSAYRCGHTIATEFGLHWDSFLGDSCKFCVSNGSQGEHRVLSTAGRTIPLTCFNQPSDLDDTDDSDWDSESDEEDEDCTILEDAMKEAGSLRQRKTLCPTIYQPIHALFNTLGLKSVRRLSIPMTRDEVSRARNELILGVSPSAAVAAGVFIRKRDN